MRQMILGMALAATTMASGVAAAGPAGASSPAAVIKPHACSHAVGQQFINRYNNGRPWGCPLDDETLTQSVSLAGHFIFASQEFQNGEMTYGNPDQGDNMVVSVWQNGEVNWTSGEVEWGSSDPFQYDVWYIDIKNSFGPTNHDLSSCLAGPDCGSNDHRSGRWPFTTSELPSAPNGAYNVQVEGCDIINVEGAKCDQGWTEAPVTFFVPVH